MVNSSRLVISECPGQDGSDRILFNLYRSAGILFNGLTRAYCSDRDLGNNAFSPNAKTKRSYVNEQSAKQLLDPIIASKKWDRIDLIGETALRVVAGKRGVSKWRGSPLTLEGGHKALAILDPLALMKDQSMLLVSANDLNKSLVEPAEHYKPFPTIDDVRNFNATTFSFDIECPRYKTMGPNAPAEMVGLCATATEAMCVPIRGEYVAELRRIFSNAKVLIGHNAIQFDIPKLFPALGIEWKPE